MSNVGVFARNSNSLSVRLVPPNHKSKKFFEKVSAAILCDMHDHTIGNQFLNMVRLTQ